MSCPIEQLWKVLESFAGTSLRKWLSIQSNGRSINAPSNGLLLASDFHEFYDAFEMAFEHISSEVASLLSAHFTTLELTHSLPSQVPDTYRVVMAPRAHRKAPKPTVVFETHTDDDPPSPTLLALHYALFQVINANAGAEAFFDRFRSIDRDLLPPHLSQSDPDSEDVLGLRYVDWQLRGLALVECN